MDAPANAQVIYGTIMGAVTDASGGTVPGTRLKITSLGTNEVTTASTSAAGTYRFRIWPAVCTALLAAWSGVIRALGIVSVCLRLLHVAVSSWRVLTQCEPGRMRRVSRCTTSVHPFCAVASEPLRVQGRRLQSRLQRGNHAIVRY